MVNFSPYRAKQDENGYLVVEGRNGIKATIIAHSKADWALEGCGNTKEIVSVVAEYPRIIHAEVMTHRQFGRNSASSRAIPTARMLELVSKTPAMPVHWGKNQSGMQAKEHLAGWRLKVANFGWLLGADLAIQIAKLLNAVGLHKQIANRGLETYQMMRVLITATEWDNFFNLRCHKDAQPEIQELANCIYYAMKASEAETLRPGEWHTPFVRHLRINNELAYYVLNEHGIVQVLDVDQAQKISCSCAAQLSYRRNDNSLSKALSVYDKLANAEPVHASAFEHTATPMENPFGSSVADLADGETHIDKYGHKWSGNLQGFIQYRQLIPNHVCTEYKGATDTSGVTLTPSSSAAWRLYWDKPSDVHPAKVEQS